MASASREDRRHRSVDEWIGVAEASRILSISPPTLRRWSDAGRVPSRKTPGGHRRYSRQSIESLISYGAGAEPPTTTSATVAVHEPLDRRDLVRQEWHRRVSTEPGIARMRGLGQRLLGLLLQHVHTRLNESHYLEEAKAVGTVYGGEAAQARISLSDTVQAFVYFRRACARLTASNKAGSTQGDLIEAVALHERIDIFMDVVLLGVLEGYEGDSAPAAVDPPVTPPA